MEWKSDNYRIFKTTPIQTGKRGADVERAGPSPIVVHKLGGRISREQRVSVLPQLKVPGTSAQGSSSRKISSHNFWLHKPVGIELVEETAGAPSNSS